LAFRRLTALFAGGVIVLLLWMAVQMAVASKLSLAHFGLGFITASDWNPVRDRYGALPFIYGTVVSSLLALCIAVPISLGIAIYLSELAHPKLRTPMGFLVELLAAVPSVVYGLWGIFALAPWLRETVEPMLSATLGFLPLFQGPHQGFGMLAGGIILAIMITPTISSVSREVLRAVPQTLREGATGLGATRWEVVRVAVLPYAKSGLVGAVILGLGRALGETMAITMVIGNRSEIAISLFAPSYTMASVIANEFTEATGELYLAALAEIGLLLFGVTRRKWTDRIVRSLCVLGTLIALVPLASVLYYVLVRGIGGINLEFFTELPKPVGESGGGMGNALLGTLKLVGLAGLFGIPPGVLAGVYLAEFGNSRFAYAVRFAADVMSGVPSITVGIFVYSLVVVTTKQFSALAGGIALAILMLPMVTRTTEELLKLVPESLREAALGLGVPKWRATLRVMLRTAAPGIAVGVMLSVARVAGETAPLLFTAFNNRFWSTGLNEPTASLPVNIYTNAVSPYEDWHRQAWAAALVLLITVLILNITARFLVRSRVGAR
jgi:phosphate ABC transporter permease protein PstC/phosphate ABC transporter permease subunit PstA